MINDTNRIKMNLLDVLNNKKVNYKNKLSYSFYQISIWFKHYRKFRLSDNINFYLVLIIFVYLIIEILFNYTLFYQMSVRTSAKRIEDIEFYSKVISGIGFALMYMKATMNFHWVSFRKTMIYLVLYSCLGFGLSYILQKAVVFGLVNTASFEQRNAALLMSQANMGLTPIYNDQLTNDTFVNRHIQYLQSLVMPTAKNQSLQKQQAFFAHADKCSARVNKSYDKIYPIRTGVDKAFFSFVGLKDYKRHEATHKKISQAYYVCMLNHQDFLQTQIDLLSPMKVAIDKHYQSYAQASRDYKSKLPSYQDYKRQVDNKWDEKVREQFGADMSLPVGMSESAFYQHPTIAKLTKKNLYPKYREYLSASDEYNEKMRRYPMFKNRINNGWYQKVREQFGEKASLPPNLSEEKFYNHSDVIKLAKTSMLPRFKSYQAASQEYKAKLNEYPSLKSKAKIAWDKAIHKQFGIKASIAPGMSKKAFFNHPNVMQMVKKNPALQQMPYPYAKNMKV